MQKHGFMLVLTIDRVITNMQMLAATFTNRKFAEQW